MNKKELKIKLTIWLEELEDMMSSLDDKNDPAYDDSIDALEGVYYQIESALYDN